MANTTQSLRVQVTGDASKLRKELDGVAGRLDKFGSKLSSTGKAMTMWVTGPLALAGGAAVKMASDLEQSAGAVESVFGDASDTIEDFGETAAQSFGLSRREVNETAAQLGAQLQSVGFSSQEAAEQVVTLQQRAADMAATFGGSTRKALEAIGSLLRGERDPIEQYGVAIKQADVNARLAAQGLDHLTGEARKQAEATAALNLLMEQTNRIEGQFARESDTAAGSQQRLQAQLENTAAEIGQNLLPVKVKATQAVAGLTGAFDDLSPAAQNTALALGGVAAATGPVLWGVGAIAQGTGNLITGFNTARDAAGKLNTRLGGLRGTFLTGLGIGVTVAAVYELQRAWRTTAEETERAVDRMIETSSSQEEAVAKVNEALQEHKDEVTSLERLWSRLGHSLTGPVGAFFNARNALEDAARALGLLQGRSRAANAEFDATGEILPSVTEFVDGLNGPLNRNSDLLGDTAVNASKAGDEMAEAGDKAGELSDAARGLKEDLEGLNSSTLNVEEAAIRWGNQIGSLDEKLRQSATTLDMHSEEGRANRQMILDTVSAAKAHVQAMIDDGATTEQAARALNTHVAELKSQMRQAGFTEAQVDSYIGTLKLTPDHVNTLVTAQTEQAEAKVRSLKGWLDQLPRNTQLAVNLATGGGMFGVGVPTGHSGGMVGDLPLTGGRLSADERLVKAQTGERLLNRRETQAFNQLHGGEMVAVLRRIEGKLDRPQGGDGDTIIVNNPQPRPSEESIARANRNRTYLAGR